MLAQKPPMGWNSWNTFGENISEELLMQTADAIAASGLKEAGYEYVVIDDCWSLRERDADGNLAADPAKFPRGMKFLADYIHSRGLKFGMYSCAGTLTCAGYPSSFDHEFQDAKRFADWGVDFLKYDFCNKPSQSFGPLLYHRMGIALKASGREILFSACNWGSDEVEKWIRSSGAHMYRSTGDIGDSFVSFKDIALSQVSKLCCAAPGCFNDLDMLIVGMYGKGNVAVSGCTDAEYLMHFALWCMMASPLMIGCDVRSMSDATKATLLNKELLRINQDAEARPAYRLHVHGGGETLYLFRHLENNEYALAAFNFGEHSVNNYVDFFEAGIPATSGYGMKLTEVLSGEALGTLRQGFRCALEPHNCKIFRGAVVPA